MVYERAVNRLIRRRLEEPRGAIQALVGPRQSGKSTSILQVLEVIDGPSHYASADTATLQSTAWLEEQWAIAREMLSGSRKPVVLVIDEVQKVPDWSAWVKRFFDEDTRARRDIHVVILGSSPLLVQQGLSESLAGRFEVIPVTHWLWPECRDAFGWDLDTYVFYGGYPGAARFVHDPVRWRAYVADTIVETTVSRDILLMTRVDKPGLLRRVLYLACEHSGQEISYDKMIGQLQDAGNTITVAHYLDLLEGAGLASGLMKYSGRAVRRRRSSPKLAVHNTALMNAVGDWTLEEARADPARWGRLVEACVGAHLVALSRRERAALYYWRTRDDEVDYVYARGRKATAVEVKSGARVGSLAGVAAFREAYPEAEATLVGTGGTPLDEFLEQGPARGLY